MRFLLELACDEQVLDHRELPEETNVLERATDTNAGDLRWRERSKTLRAVGDGAPIGFVDARDQVEERCLACTVGSDETEDDAVGHGEADVTDRTEAAELLRDVLKNKRHQVPWGAPGGRRQKARPSL